MELASDSRGWVYSDRLVLEAGTGQLEGTGYRIEARTLQIAADEPNTAARVALTGTSRVQVGAIHGRLHVTNAQGMLVANLLAGSALEFEPQTDAALTTTMHLAGIVTKEGGTFFLTDETTHVTVALRPAW